MMERIIILEDESGLVDVDLAEVYEAIKSCQNSPTLLARFKKKEDLAKCTKSILNFRIKTLTGRTVHEIEKEMIDDSKDTTEVIMDASFLKLLAHFLILYSNGVPFNVQTTDKSILSSPSTSGYMESTRIDTPLISTNQRNCSKSPSRTPARSPSRTPATSTSKTPATSTSKTHSKSSPSTSKLKNQSSANPSSCVKSKATQYDSDEEQPSGKNKYVGRHKTSQIVDASKSKWNLPSVLMYVSVGLSVLVGSHHVYQQSTPKFRLYGEQDALADSHWAQARNTFTTKLKGIRESLPNQNKKSWTLISSAVKQAIHSRPDYPAVLLLLANATAEQTSACLATKIADAAASVLGDANVHKDIIVKALDLANIDIQKTKRDLTENLHSTLSSERSVAILQLEKLHPEVAMTLHAFTDNANAPYKRAVIVMSLLDDTQDTGVDKEDSQDRSVDKDQKAEKILVKSWGQVLGDDKVYALVSRIAVNVIEVQEEPVARIKEACPVM